MSDNNLLNKARAELQETKRETFREIAQLMNSAFALVAALAWNEAIKAVIDRYFPAGSAVYSRFLYAIIITLLVVIVMRRLQKFSKHFETNETNAT